MLVTVVVWLVCVTPVFGVMGLFVPEARPNLIAAYLWLGGAALVAAGTTAAVAFPHETISFQIPKKRREYLRDRLEALAEGLDLKLTHVAHDEYVLVPINDGSRRLFAALSYSVRLWIGSDQITVSGPRRYSRGLASRLGKRRSGASSFFASITLTKEEQQQRKAARASQQAEVFQQAFSGLTRFAVAAFVTFVSAGCLHGMLGQSLGTSIQIGTGIGAAVYGMGAWKARS
jgi:hypothetical protein